MVKKSISRIGDKLAKVNDSFTINMYDNGFMLEIGGRSSDEEWSNVKLTVSSIEELVALIKEATDLPRDN